MIFSDTAELQATLDEQYGSLSPEERRNVGTILKWLPVWFRNLGRNASLIYDAFQNFGDRNLIHAFDPVWLDSPDPCAIIVGSGVSVDQILDPDLSELLQAWKGIIIAGATNASILCAAGRPPDIIMAVDSAPEVSMAMRWGPYASLGCKLLTNPYIDHSLLLEYPMEQTYFYNSYIPFKNHPLNWYTSQMFTGTIENFLLQAGCSTNQQVLAAALPYPKQQRIKKLFLLGVDFCYPDDPSFGLRDRFLQHRYTSGSWRALPKTHPRTRSKMVQHRSGKWTDLAMVGYKRSLYILQGICKHTMFDCSGGLAITPELPQVSLADVLSSQGSCVQPWDAQQILDWYHAFLAEEKKDPDVWLSDPSHPRPPVQAPEQPDHPGLIVDF